MEEGAQETKPQNSGNTKYIAIVGIIVIIIAVIGIGYETTHKHAMMQQQAATPAPHMSAKTAVMKPASPKALYKDGTYTAEGDYMVHIGPEHVQVTITLKNDDIVASTVVAEASDPISKFEQGRFISGYKPLVIGKDITTVHLGKVSSSSLTPNGFNDALTKIEAKAKA